ncbi:transposase [Streptomyces sp. 2132.2]|uniref:transposase n=1 Tax=Streptomyces sp. 2132.2 TaxID=2485161 RepID=UPI0021A6C5B2|nr:transposase [Streptomyces sp. 2132.2]
MTDAEWLVVRPLLPMPGRTHGQCGPPETYCHRAMLDAIGYLVDNGIKWRAMPADSPPWDRVYAFFQSATALVSATVLPARASRRNSQILWPDLTARWPVDQASGLR